MADFTRLSDIADIALLVWGGGTEGRAAVDHALSHGCSVTMVSDDPTHDTRSRQLADEHHLNVISPSELATATADFLIRSPGVVKYRAEVESLRQRGIGSSNLCALWLADQDPNRLVGVTGTKGKSTTATLIAELLRAAGNTVALAGNIGVAVTDVPRDVDVTVVEVSSYQASDCTTSPCIGVLTTLDQDHLQWHGSVERYHRDKLNLFAHPELRHLVCNTSDSYTTTRAREHGLSPDDEFEDIIDSSALAIAVGRNPHGLNLSSGPMRDNLRLAVRAARLFDPSVTMSHVSSVIGSFQPLPSRQRVVAVRNGITFVDDALASNPHGVVAALETFVGHDIVLILGGQDRGVDYSTLRATIDASHNVKALVLLGSADDPIAHQFAACSATQIHVGSQDVARAVELARSHAGDGTYILFSPGAPTPVEIGTYADRSASFALAANTAP